MRVTPKFTLSLVALALALPGSAYALGLGKLTVDSALEPYLDLIVEVNWASGRVVRDYTLLLDPPGINTGAPVQPVAPLRQGTGAAAPLSRGGTTAPATSTAAAPRAPGEGYTVKRGDTLAKIATDNKSADVTLDQMLVALFKANNDAFAGNNMNRLRAGAIMTIPDASTVSAEPATDSQKVVRVQASDSVSYTHLTLPTIY